MTSKRRMKLQLSSKAERDVTANFELESARFHAHTGAISGEIELNGMKMSVAHKRHFQDAALKQVAFSVLFQFKPFV